MKVVHILEGFLGGTSTYMCTVLPELVCKGCDVTLICSTDRYCPDSLERLSRLKSMGVEVNIIPMCRQISPLRDLRSFFCVLRLLRTGRFDVVHTHCSKAGALGRVASVLSGKKVTLHTPHCFAFVRCNSRIKGRLYLAIEKLLGRLTTKLVAVSSSEAETAVGHTIVPYNKCTNVANGLLNGQHTPKPALQDNLIDIKHSLGIEHDTQVVTTACRLVEYKGINRFIQAAKLSRIKNVVFLIAGDGELKGATEKFIMDNGLSGKVRMLGHISEMEKIYAISDIVALCSDAEGQPYLLLEAMRAKRPIVATSVIGNRELISHEKTGLLTGPDPQSIAHAIDSLLADECKRDVLARNAYSYFCMNHALERQVSELLSIYTSLVKNG